MEKLLVNIVEKQLKKVILRVFVTLV